MKNINMYFRNNKFYANNIHLNLPTCVHTNKVILKVQKYNSYMQLGLYRIVCMYFSIQTFKEFYEILLNNASREDQ